MSDQLSLFATTPQADPKRPVGPVAVDEPTLSLARARPTGLYLGTSSWSFPGWRGLVWDREVSERTLSKHGLRAYAEHPLFNAVGLDRTHYAPMSASALRECAADVPDHFRFLMKAHEAITLRTFPSHPRYGQRAGQVNPDYLNPEYAVNEVLGPAAEGFGQKLFVVLFQFAPQSPRKLGTPEGFAEDLHRFFSHLPRNLRCAVELRNEELLTDAYRDALLDTDVIHCLSSIPKMPSPLEQARMMQTAIGSPVIIRWMLHPRYAYQEAYRAYHPFADIVDEDRPVRAEISTLIQRALGSGREVMVIANNKAEGCAPKSLAGLLSHVVNAGPPPVLTPSDKKQAR